MTSFEFNSVGRLVFGCGEVRRLGPIAAAIGKTALLVHNTTAPLADKLASLLAEAGLSPLTVRQDGEPKVQDIDTALERARSADCDLVIGLGGGSAIDCAKAVAGLLTNGGSVVDYLEVVGKGQKITRPATPWIAIPTTAGTGAEATRNAVIGYPEKQFKASIRSELLLAKVALIDPELGVDVPAAVTASSGMDALCQLIESYTSTGAQPLTDALALEGIHRAARSLAKACRNGHDLAARQDMAIAAYLSGVTLTNAGLGAVHGFAAPLGANFPVPHGTVCAALLPHVIAYNIAALQAQPTPQAEAALARYAKVGRLLAADDTLQEDQALQICVTFTATLATDLQIPPLHHFNMTDADVPAMVQLAKKASSMRYNPVVLSDDALAQALTAAIRGDRAQT